MTIALAACSGSNKNRLDYSDKNQLGNLPVVAHQVEVDGQKMTVKEEPKMKEIAPGHEVMCHLF